jgi:hypothetical protein
MSEKIDHKLRRRAVELRDGAIQLARDIEAKFGKEDDRTIFARNAYCELQEVSNMLAPSRSKAR